MKKSLDEIWSNIQNNLQIKKEQEERERAELLERAEYLRKEKIKRDAIYESISAANSNSSSAAGGKNIIWNTIYDTIWLYPIIDFEATLDEYKGMSPSIVINDNYIEFSSIEVLYEFYKSTWDKTATSNISNGIEGYNLGVGTKLRDLGKSIYLVSSETNYIVIEWRLVKQITDQSTLNSGGDSPNGTIGYIAIYTDWLERGIQDTPYDPNDPGYSAVSPTALGFEYGDPLRVRV